MLHAQVLKTAERNAPPLSKNPGEGGKRDLEACMLGRPKSANDVVEAR